MKKSLFAIVFVEFISLIMGQPLAQASVGILSGGDPGEGYAPLPLHVAAYDLGNNDTVPSAPPNQVVQGVTFAPFVIGSEPANTSVTGASSNFEGIADVGPSADDKALTIINKFEFFAVPASGPMVVTIGGLTTGVSYQVDLFVHSNTTRNGDFTIGTAAPDNLVTSSPDFYDIRETVAAVGGQIVISVTSSDSSFPFLNALSITTPEPASMSLIAVGVSALLMVRRRRTQAA